MSRLFLIFIVFVPVTSAAQIGKVMASNFGTPADYVYVSGKTNINCFECSYNKKQADNYCNNFQLTYDNVSGETIKAEIPVSEFECSNEIMYDDFRKLLKAGEYPYIRIELDFLQIENILPGNSSYADLMVSLSIASITNVQPVSCLINNTGNNTISVTGTTTINILDFQLEPPVKFFGLVRVKDEVTINFSFNFIVI